MNTAFPFHLTGAEATDGHVGMTPCCRCSLQRASQPHNVPLVFTEAHTATAVQNAAQEQWELLNNKSCCGTSATYLPAVLGVSGHD